MELRNKKWTEQEFLDERKKGEEFWFDLEDYDKINGLNVGADDYVSKPFNPLELTARVKSQLRRYTKLGNKTVNNGSVFQTGGLVINDDLKEVTVDGEPVRLTPTEYSMLLLLVQNKVFHYHYRFQNSHLRQIEVDKFSE